MEPNQEILVSIGIMGLGVLMANSKLKCKGCKEYYRVKENHPSFRRWCSDKCALDIVTKSRLKERERAKKQQIWQKKEDKRVKKYWKQKKKELISRTKWYNRLQSLVNQFVTKVRDKDKGCFTCGKTTPTVKYDAGHCFTRKARPDIRFDLHNIHKQCSVECNQHGSGMRAEYFEAIVDKYGKDELARLKLEGKPLKEQFPHWEDIENEIIRYRKLLRDNGVTPNI